MAGLKRVTDLNRFRNKANAVSEKVLGDSVSMDWTERGADTAYEDDGALHVRKKGLHVVFSIGQDTRGQDANEQTRAILTALNMKRFIGEKTLVNEECESCDGDGFVACGHGDHECYDCGGTGMTEVPTE